MKKVFVFMVLLLVTLPCFATVKWNNIVPEWVMPKLYVGWEWTTNNGATWYPAITNAIQEFDLSYDYPQGIGYGRGYYRAAVTNQTEYNTGIDLQTMVYYGVRLDGISNQLALIYMFLRPPQHFLTNLVYRPWITITNYGTPPLSLLDCTNCPDNTNLPPLP